MINQEAFWKRFNKMDNGCWEWQGSKSTGRAAGYGTVKIKGKVFLVHRVAWVITFGEIPEGLEVCHDCDNRICGNPAHLFLGTHYQNMQDMYQKGRSNIHGVHRMWSGDVTQLAESIRDRWTPGMSGNAVARLFGKSYGGSWYKKVNAIVEYLKQ